MLRRHRKAFLLGCIELDFNIFSYLRGMRRYKKFHGHNAENSFMFLVHCADVFDENAPRSAWDYFRLGTAIHYIADAFTASHNGFWTGSLLEHSAYETALHREFKAMLKSACPEQIPRREYAPLHRVYRTEKHNVEIYFRYILTVCLSVMRKYVLGAAEQEEAYDASFNYGRPA